MKFLSVCSGIEAASVAFHPLGWRAVAFSEIEPFPSAVLAHHYPGVPNLGDMNAYPYWPDEIFLEADAVVGGPPCQAFSIAGLRAGLHDDRGNLTLTYAELINHADELRIRAGKPPVAVLYENVPGLLSDKTNAFGCLLAGLAGEDEPLVPSGKRWPNAGYVLGPQRAVAWRILDAQYFGLAQRRRRVFVVASARNGFDPATVLFEWDGVRRDSAPRREARGGTAGRAEAGVTSGGYTPEVTGALTARGARNMGQSNDDVDGHKIISMAHGQGGAEVCFDRSPTLTCNHEAPIAAYPATAHTLLGKPNCSHAADKETYVVHPLRGEGFDASEDGTGRGTPLGPVAFSCKDYGADAGEVAPTLRSRGHDKSHANAGGQVAIAFNARQDPDHWHDRTGPLDTDGGTQAVSYAIQAGALRTNPASGPDGVGVQADHAYSLEARAEVQAVAFDTTQITSPANYSNPKSGDPCHPLAAGAHPPAIATTMQVRRLTPRECERLQGFPDGYTAIPWRRGKLDAFITGNECPDGPRYKALGNSWAVPVVRWIGSRIDAHLKGELCSPEEAFL